VENRLVRGSVGLTESFYAYLEKTRDRTVDEPGNGPFFFMTSLHPLIAFSPPILAFLKSNKAIKASRAVITLAAARIRCLSDFVPPAVLCGIVSVAVLERDAVVTIAIVIIDYFSTHDCSALAGCRNGFVKGVSMCPMESCRISRGDRKAALVDEQTKDKLVHTWVGWEKKILKHRFWTSIVLC
jgi:hypothetical protein